MKRSFITLLAALLGILALDIARAEDAPSPPSSSTNLPPDVTIDDVLHMLRTKSPRMAAHRADVDVAAAEIVAASVLPNPSLSLSALSVMQGENTQNGTQYMATMTQPLLISGQRGARKRTARLALEATQARTQATYAELAADARKLFISLLAAEERIKALERASADLGHAQTIIAGRVQGGAMSKFDALRLDIEGKTLQTRLSEARADAENTAGELAVLLGFPGWRPKAIGKLQAPGVSNVQAMAPAINAARKEEAAAQSGIDLAERERVPIPFVSAGALVTTQGYSLSGYVGLQMDLPIFNWGQGNIARARAEAQRATRVREATEARVSTELARARQLLKNRTDALRRFEDDVMARLPTMREMAEDAYRHGQGTILDFLDTSRTVTDTHLSFIDRVESVLHAEVDVLAASGLVDPQHEN